MALDESTDATSPNEIEDAGELGTEAEGIVEVNFDESVEVADAPESAMPPEPSPAPVPEPAAVRERVTAVDVLRGVALLGILAMNIVDFGWPRAVYENPRRTPGYDAYDEILWGINHVVFDTKMMTIFSMLFGAGLVLMDERATAKGAALKRTYFRRVLILLGIGLIHAYFIWEGDILVDYAECGLILYFFRKKSAKTLLIVGACLVFFAIPFFLAVRSFLHYARNVSAEVAVERKAGREPTGFRAFLDRKWHSIEDADRETPSRKSKFHQNIRIHQGGYWGIVEDRAGRLLGSQTIGFLLGGFWLIGGRMLIGMGLMKLGILSASRSTRFYVGMLLFGYGIGLPLVIYDTFALLYHDFSLIGYQLEGGILYNVVGGVFVVIGHIAAVMLIVKHRMLPRLTERLAAVGRMALTNYLGTSIVCTTIFYGYGFGLFGSLHRPELYFIVISIWAIQLVLSPLWLERFRYGPAEWFWRSLTYGKLQPLRIERAEEISAAAAV